ncbi:MAG: hypothetical protein NTV08_17745 [Verrucomicrobia bacterium]|nr:hypothetical protein [Verrucomicrobiota bacterium]
MSIRAFLFFILVCTAAVRGDGTALDALKLLPKDAAKRLARIEAREGTPAPERWYLLVHDPVEPRGVREFVVAGGKFVTSRTLSQFADALKPSDVIGADTVKVDSSHVAKLAAAFAEANGAKVGSLNYELTRDAASNLPAWKVTVLDPVGDQIGVLAVNATRGAVLSAEGFEKSPAAELLAPPASVGSVAAAGGKKPKATPTLTPTPKPGVLKRFLGGGSKTPKPEQ